MAELPPGLRYPTQGELDQLAREPRPFFTGGPYVGGWLQIGYRTLLLTEDEARAIFGSQTDG